MVAVGTKNAACALNEGAMYTGMGFRTGKPKTWPTDYVT